MERTEITNTIRFLNEKRNYFFAEANEFDKNISPSFTPINPKFRYNFDLFKDELAYNIYSDFNTSKSYYDHLLEELRNDDFTESFKYKPSHSFLKYEDKESFLNEYYTNNPHNGLGEGEIEYIIMCFEGYLYNYECILNNIIEIIQSKLKAVSDTINTPNLDKKIKQNSTYKGGLSDEELKEKITEKINHLNGVYKNEIILSNEEYLILETLIFKLIKNDEVPEEFPLKFPSVSLSSFRYTMYLIHDEIYGTNKINHNFINFIYNYSRKISSKTELKTLKTKFSEKPKRYPF